jgi:ribosomal protein S14
MRLKSDTVNRKACYEVEILNKVLKTVVSKSNVVSAVRWAVSKRFSSFFDYTSRLNNRCNVNGKSRSVIRCLRFNRLVIVSYQAKRLIKGFSKVS